MNTKAKGNRNEHRSIAILEAAGYQCTRAAASLGAWDIVGISADEIILLQVKTRDWPGPAERDRLLVFAAPSNCRKLIHRYIDRRKFPDVREL